jgi:predicted amidohydrolase
MVIAYANYCGSEGNVTYGGKSVIVDGNGAVIAQAGRCPTLLIADLAQIVQPLSTQHQDYRDINRA